MKSNLISVVVPVYGVEEYIEDLIISLKDQSYKDFEVLLVDDGSKDSSIEIAEKLIKEHDLKNFNIMHKENGGLSDARNFGTKHAKGEYITYIDSDDYVTNDYLEKLYNKMIESNADVVVGSFKYFNQNEKEINDVIKGGYYENVYEGITRNDIFVDMYNSENYYPTSLATAWGKLYRLNIIKDNNIEYPYGKIHEDEFTTYKIYLNSKKIVYINEALYIYRIRDNSIMTNGYNEKSVDILEAFRERIEVFKDHGIKTLKTETQFTIALFRHYHKRKIYLNKVSEEIKEEGINEYNHVFPKVDFKTKIKLFLARYLGQIFFRFR